MSAELDLCGCEIRKAERRQLEEVYRIERASFEHPYPKLLLLWYMAVLGDTFIVAVCDGKVVGYSISAMERRGKGHILSIAVSPDFRRRGIGTALLAETIRRLRRRGADRIVLEVRTSNEAAIGLYEKAGFKITGRLENYYGDGEDAYLMELEVAQTEAP